VAAAGIGLEQVMLDGDDVYWIELRPAEGGRCVVVRRAASGAVSDITPAPFNARNRVHEYGGGAYAVRGGVVFFSSFDDGRLYRCGAGESPSSITPDGAYRYADLVVDLRRDRLICVREDHTASDREAVNTIVSVSCRGGVAPRVLVSGADFYAAPRLSADGSRLAWLAWNHPNMPWDGTELWVGELARDGTVAGARRIAGGPKESVLQPEWGPDGTLYFLADPSGWWNPHRWRDGRIEPVVKMPAEFGGPMWRLGQATYAVAPDGRLVCAYKAEGTSRLAWFDPSRGTPEPIALPHTAFDSIRCGRPGLAFIGGSSADAPAVVLSDLRGRRVEVLRKSSNPDVDPAYFSRPEPIEFPTEGGLTAHGLYYAPVNPDAAPPEDERPPLIVSIHGGPTASASATLNLGIQYWTSRGFAVVDVNYGGSTGYGRPYRERLYGQWGVVDVDDAVNAARYLVARGSADPDRLIIHGGSAGGYTTLSALAFRDVFAAGASYFGISDLVVFHNETHKFESRYDEHLVGPFPDRIDLYRERSAISAIDRWRTPLILFQGLEDKIVPPNQSEMIFEAAKRRGVPVAYLPYPGEQHGFRRAEHIKRTFEAEASFYSQIFGFPLADRVEAVAFDKRGAGGARGPAADASGRPARSKVLDRGRPAGAPQPAASGGRASAADGSRQAAGDEKRGRRTARGERAGESEDAEAPEPVAAGEAAVDPDDLNGGSADAPSEKDDAERSETRVGRGRGGTRKKSR
jgi:dipeptidyl aminopeptidase/acylaminoacyl peptidase